MQYVDVHCHLDSSFYNKDIDSVVLRAKENKVKAIAAGINPETNRQVLSLREKYPDVICASLGIYPPDALKKEGECSGFRLDLDYDIDDEIKFIYENRANIVAVGEVGMDFKDGSDFDGQEKIFRKTIGLAISLDKTLVVHSRKAEQKVIEILEGYNYKRIVMHCFCGKHALVKRVRDNQWHLSIPASAVRDEHFQQMIKETPLHLLLTETDSPFLSPFKGVRNEPSFVMETVKLFSRLRNIPEEDVANILFKNARRVFGI